MCYTLSNSFHQVKSFHVPYSAWNANLRCSYIKFYIDGVSNCSAFNSPLCYGILNKSNCHAQRKIVFPVNFRESNPLLCQRVTEHQMFTNHWILLYWQSLYSCFCVAFSMPKISLLHQSIVFFGVCGWNAETQFDRNNATASGKKRCIHFWFCLMTKLPEFKSHTTENYIGRKSDENNPITK